MVQLATVLIGDRALAEDVVHEAFIRLHDRLDDLDRPGAYLRTTVINLCRNHRRHEAVRDRRPPPDAGYQEEPRLPRELSELWLALDRIPDRQREALVLRFYLDLSDETIADHLDTRPGTVRSLISRGKAALRKELRP